MATKQNCEGILRDVFDRMSLSDQNQLHGLLLVVERLVDERAVLLKTTNTAQLEETLFHWILEVLLAKQHLASKSNVCVLTRCLYLDVLRKMFELHFQDDAAASLPLEWLEFITSCADDLRTSLSVKNEQFLFDAEFYIAQLKLCLAVKLTGCEELQVNGLILLGLQQHCPPDVKLFVLKVLNSMSLLEGRLVEGISPLVQTLLASKDQDILAQVYELLAEHLQVYELLAEHLQSNSALVGVEDTVSNAMLLFSQNSIRLELRLSLLHFIATALPLVDNATPIKFLLAWLEQGCVPTQPVELRAVAASELPSLWTVIVSSESAAGDDGIVSLYCRVVVSLLQDPSCGVREEAATSVAKILPGRCEVERPNSSSALQWFISSLPVLVPNVSCCCSALLSLVSLEAELSRQSTNPLFDEDPVNDYAEELVVLEHVMQCLDHMTVTHCRVVTAHLAPLKERLTKWGTSSGVLGGSVWENPGIYMQDMKMKAFSKLNLKAKTL